MTLLSSSSPLLALEDVLFHVVEALRVPVLIAVLLALAVAIVELGSLAVELGRRRGPRRGSRTPQLDRQVALARTSLAAGERRAAADALAPLATSAPMAEVLAGFASHVGGPGAEPRLAKALADFDLRSLRRLERTRLLVRAGPALGLMGTLIPLTPALAGLAGGDIEQLSDNLRVAFSVTVIGLLAGAVGFGVSLVRDRLYAQDLSDLEYVAATLSADASEDDRSAAGGVPADEARASS